MSLQETLRQFAECDHASLQCEACKATATITSWLPNQDGWVSVDIQLPPEDVPVWLHGPRHTWIGCRTHVVGEGWFWAECGQPWIKDGKWVADVADVDDYEATHWMPLPTLPLA